MYRHHSVIVGSFNRRLPWRGKINNTTCTVEGTHLVLRFHGNAIARWGADGLQVTSAGWHSSPITGRPSSVTKERLNLVDGVSVSQKNYQWYLNGEDWGDCEWTTVNPVPYSALTTSPENIDRFTVFAHSLSGARWKVASKVKRWKRDPKRWQVTIRKGNNWVRVTNENAHEWVIAG